MQLTSERGGLRVDGASVEHRHDLANKIFGDEVGEWQNLCADQLHHL